MTATETELHPCACGCGELVTGTWARGHHRRGPAASQPLPGPDEDDLDLGFIDLDEPGEPPSSGQHESDGPPVPPEPSEPEDSEPVQPLGFPSPPRGKAGKPRPATARVTAATRKDIAAKVGLMLYVPGQIWAARDPWCGGTFVQQAPAIGDALTDIICDSPDLVAFFTGPAGGFMKYLTLLTACQPVAVMAWQHHIAHTIGQPEANGQPQPDMAQYAA